MTDPPGLLGAATVVDARTGRKLNNALTLTFRTSPEDTVAVGAQVGSAWVLLGFKNTGDAGPFTLKGPAGELAVDCRAERTTVTTASGDPSAPSSGWTTTASCVTPAARSWPGSPACPRSTAVTRRAGTR